MSQDTIPTPTPHDFLADHIIAAALTHIQATPTGERMLDYDTLFDEIKALLANPPTSYCEPILPAEQTP